MHWHQKLTLVDGALRSCAALAEQTGEGEWDFAVANGGALLGRARLCEEWLVLDLPCDGALDAARTWDLLPFNPRLNGHAKFALRRRAVHLRAEIPITGQTDLTLRLTDCHHGFQQGLALACGYSPAPVEQAASAFSLPASRDLAELLEEAGWPAVQRDANRFAVELEVGAGLYRQALLRCGEEGLRITA